MNANEMRKWFSGLLKIKHKTQSSSISFIPFWKCSWWVWSCSWECTNICDTWAI